MRPGRRSTGAAPERSTMVDSMPTSVGPPSSTRSTSPPRSAYTCAEVVGETWPKRFAEGAATPPPNCSSKFRATGCDGRRMPTVSWPPVTKSFAFCERRRTRVSGPGQNFAPRRRAEAGVSRVQEKASPPPRRSTRRRPIRRRSQWERLPGRRFAGCEPLARCPYSLATRDHFPPLPDKCSQTTAVISGSMGAHPGETRDRIMASSNTQISPAAASDACGLERLPHVMNKLCQLWGQPACDAYISRLIMDSRDGARQGLPWEVAMELMFLAELSVGRRALVASAATGVPFGQMLQRFREMAPAGG